MEYKAPGVYIVDKGAFPNTVVEVPTAIPAFLGYTEKVRDGSESRKYVPTYIESIADYAKVFGGPPTPQFTLTPSADKSYYSARLDPANQFFLYYAIHIYFANGGGPAYILSVGSYDEAMTKGKSAKDFLPNPDPNNLSLVAPFDALKKVPDVTLIVAPDTTLLNSADDCYAVWTNALQHCNDMQNRMALIDIYGGNQARTHDAATDVVSGSSEGFREKIGTDFLNYGAAYYPWLNFDIVDESSVTYCNLDDASLQMLIGALNDELKQMNPPPTRTLVPAMQELYSSRPTRAVADNNGNSSTGAAGEAAVARIHNQLLAVSPLYKRVASEMLQLVDQMPPAAAMAGVYARVDTSEGVFKAPANTSISLAVSPTVDITAEDQQDLNTPLDGRAVNAIRTIPGRGLVVWGARTLDGNSQDLRYINVRRTLIMLEQSIKTAVMGYAFARNDAPTWASVKNLISNFLTSQWRNGTLQGAKAEDAFSVDVGLGTTMTGDDILNGHMRVTVMVAIVRPAEFIVLTFQQQMAIS